MPEMFGTHHTKMMILFRRDDYAQYDSSSREKIVPVAHR